MIGKDKDDGSDLKRDAQLLLEILREIPNP